MQFIFKNNIIHSMPILDDLSQGSRIAYIRQFRNLSQDDVSDSLGLTGESRITFNKQKIEEVLPFDLVKRDKRYVEAYIIEAIKEYKKSKH